MSGWGEDTVWRDGYRIASRHHGGFWDRVPDESLERYAADPKSHAEDRLFAAAALAIRRFERACEGAGDA